MTLRRSILAALLAVPLSLVAQTCKTVTWQTSDVEEWGVRGESSYQVCSTRMRHLPEPLDGEARDYNWPTHVALALPWLLLAVGMAAKLEPRRLR